MKKKRDEKNLGVGIVLTILILLSYAIYAPYQTKQPVVRENVTWDVKLPINSTEDFELIYYTSNMRVFHDNIRNVTCWKIRGGLSCIPDHLLEESIPESALLSLCGAYDEYVGAYPCSTWGGEEFFEFYMDEIEKLPEVEKLTSLEHEQEERSIKMRYVPSKKKFIISEDIAKEVSDALKDYIIHIDNDRKDLGFDFKEDRYSDRISKVLHDFEVELCLPPCRMSGV